MKPNLEHMRAGMIAAPPSLDRHELAVQGAEKRLRRAREKNDAAEAELDAATQWLARMRAERLAFIACNPDPQGVLV